MSINFDLSMMELIKWEGVEYHCDPQDPGGATKYGISKRFNPDIDIAKLNYEDAKQYYYDKYWLKYNYDKIESQPLASKVLLTCINIGNYHAHLYLQRAVRAASGVMVKETGQLTSDALAGVNACIPQSLLAAYRAFVSAHYYDKHPPGDRFCDGLQNRIMN